MPGRHLGQHRRHPIAESGDGVGTARMEGASRHDRERRRHIAADRLQRLACLAAKPRHGAQQPAGIGMAGRGEELRRRRLLDDLAQIHDGDPPGRPGDDAEIMGDQQHRHAEVGLQLLQKIEDLGLDRDVEGRRRLVRHQQARPAAERHGDHGPLAHAAAEVEGIGAVALTRIGHADDLQHLDRPLLGGGAAEALVEPQRLGDLLADRMDRRERGHGLLEDHGDLAAPHRPHGLALRIERGQIQGRATRRGFEAGSARG